MEPVKIRRLPFGRRHRLGVPAFVVAAWLLVALAWTPPTYLLEEARGGVVSWREIFLFVLLGFLPWIVATPGLLWLGARYPISDGRVAHRLVFHAMTGAVVLPLVSFAGVLLIAAVMPLGRPPFSTDGLYATTINAFYGVPTYVAVVGIAQAIGYFQRYRDRERLLARAELRALAAQLNPHFLFNLLNAVSALGYRDPERADRALTQLAQLLRTILDERPQEIPLREEIGFARSCLDLYSTILPGQASMVCTIEPTAWEGAVPALLLQPLVENAVVHGLAKLGHGSISLVAERTDNRLRIVLSNDTPEGMVAVPESGIGLANVRERLRVMYGGAACITFERAAGQAKAMVELPFRDCG